MHTGARARKQKYISIYRSLHMKTFLKTGVYIYIYIYYIDTSVLQENIPVVKFIKLHPGHEWLIFHNLTREFIDDVISVISLCIILLMSLCLYNKKNITRWLPRENKIQIFKKQYFTHTQRSFVKYCFVTRK